MYKRQVECKAASDRRNLYFMAQTASEVALSAPAHMQLMIDADADHSTGWNGFDYMARFNPEAGSYELLRHGADGEGWKPVASLSHRIEGNRLMLTLDKRALGLKGYSAVDFKWLDNCGAVEADEPMLMYSEGDCAPNHRFTYRLLPPLRR